MGRTLIERRLRDVSERMKQVGRELSVVDEQLAVIGDNRKYLSALLVPSYTALESWARQNNIAFTGRKDLISRDKVRQLYQTEIERCMKDFAPVEQVRKFVLLETEWSQDTGELTPTLKLKRKVINQKYASQIESMYPPGS